MKLLLLIVLAVALLVLFRHRPGVRRANWRAVVGFSVGAIIGLFWGTLLHPVAGQLTTVTGVPWRVLQLLFVVVGGMATAGPIRKALEEAFPPSSHPKDRHDASG